MAGCRSRVHKAGKNACEKGGEWQMPLHLLAEMPVNAGNVDP